MMNKKVSVGLNKFISDNGICSRRQADKYIEMGTVFINGKRARIADRVFIGDKVMINGIQLSEFQGEDRVYIALNKPVGVTSTTESGVKGNIVDYVNHTSRVFPVGRLDKDSQGLILLTNDGDIVNKILRAEHNHEKEYLVQVDRPFNDDFIGKMSKGVPVLGKVTKKCKVTRVSSNSFRIVLIQGLNRQIRRMCEYLGYEVVRLERTRIMHITLRGIGNGEWRELDTEEVEKLLEVCERSANMKMPSGSSGQVSKPAQKEKSKKVPTATKDESLKAAPPLVAPKPKRDRNDLTPAQIRGLKPSERKAYLERSALKDVDSRSPAPQPGIKDTQKDRSRSRPEKDKAAPSSRTRNSYAEPVKTKSQPRVGKSKVKPAARQEFNRHFRKGG